MLFDRPGEGGEGIAQGENDQGGYEKLYISDKSSCRDSSVCSAVFGLKTYPL